MILGQRIDWKQLNSTNTLWTKEKMRNPTSIKNRVRIRVRTVSTGRIRVFEMLYTIYSFIRLHLFFFLGAFWFVLDEQISYKTKMFFSFICYYLFKLKTCYATTSHDHHLNGFPVVLVSLSAYMCSCTPL